MVKGLRLRQYINYHTIYQGNFLSFVPFGGTGLKESEITAKLARRRPGMAVPLQGVLSVGLSSSA